MPLQTTVPFLLLSAAVTLGCASEKAILLLIEAFGPTLDGDDKTAFEKEANTFIISRKYRALWSRLEPIAKDLPDNLGDHLGNIHPDLQVRLMHFLKELVNEINFRVLIATHSTAILAALESYEDTCLAFMTFDQKELEFKPVTNMYKKILPVFGAHPLSNVFNEAPILLVEGEDDERIWQQVVRSSNGAIQLYPCSVDGIGNMSDLEQEAQNIIQAVYDDARGYSLRDRDGIDEEIDDLLPIVRLKLACRNAENLLLTNEVLQRLSTNWEQLKVQIDVWLDKNSDHRHYNVMNGFKNDNFDRKNYDIKEVRNDLMGIIGSCENALKK